MIDFIRNWATVVGVFFLPMFGLLFGHQLLRRRTERRLKPEVTGQRSPELGGYSQEYYDIVEYKQGEFYWSKLLGVPLVFSVFGVAAFFMLKTFDIGKYFVALSRIFFPFALAGGLFCSIFAMSMFMVQRDRGQHNTKCALPILLFMVYIGLTSYVIGEILTNSIDSYFMS